jgi:hypothetical protein
VQTHSSLALRTSSERVGRGQRDACLLGALRKSRRFCARVPVFVQGERGRGRDPRARFVGGGEVAALAGKLRERHRSRVHASTASARFAQ